MVKIVITLLLLIFPAQLFSEEKKYGSLFYNSDIPNTLFMLNDIREGDSFSLRKALRSHEINTLVLASPGGSVLEGLNMAGIVFDKGLKVYVPEKARCASACSFIFFAGKERKAQGRLGVHQFYFNNAKASGNVNQTGEVVQLTVSEIIGFLNEFDTPRFVLERMFQQQDMYYFDTEEMMQLMTNEFSVSESMQTKINTFWDVARTTLVKKEPKLSAAEGVAILQTRLNEIGCNAGLVDGKLGRKTETAIKRFSKIAGIPYTKRSSLTKEFFDKLSNAPKGYCPKVGWPDLKFAKSYRLQCYYSYISNCKYAELTNLGYSKVNQTLNLYLKYTNHKCGDSGKREFKFRENGTFMYGFNSTRDLYEGSTYLVDQSGYVNQMSYGSDYNGSESICTITPN